MVHFYGLFTPFLLLPHRTHAHARCCFLLPFITYAGSLLLRSCWTWCCFSVHLLLLLLTRCIADFCTFGSLYITYIIFPALFAAVLPLRFYDDFVVHFYLLRCHLYAFACRVLPFAMPHVYVWLRFAWCLHVLPGAFYHQFLHVLVSSFYTLRSCTRSTVLHSLRVPHRLPFTFTCRFLYILRCLFVPTVAHIFTFTRFAGCCLLPHVATFTHWLVGSFTRFCRVTFCLPVHCMIPLPLLLRLHCVLYYMQLLLPFCHGSIYVTTYPVGSFVTYLLGLLFYLRCPHLRLHCTRWFFYLPVLVTFTTNVHERANDEQAYMAGKRAGGRTLWHMARQHERTGRRGRAGMYGKNNMACNI